jgi:hypothetical protein
MRLKLEIQGMNTEFDAEDLVENNRRADREGGG